MSNNNTVVYQLCSFKHPHYKKYHMRRYTVGANGNFSSIDNFLLDEQQYDTFLRTKKPNEYKLYSTYDLHTIQPPSMSDIYLSQSSMITNDSKFYGPAKWS